MRIIGYIPHPIAKITVFQLNMKFAVKLEMGFMEQSFKVRESDTITGFDSVAKLVDEEFIESCLERFHRMNADLGSAFKRLD